MSKFTSLFLTYATSFNVVGPLFVGYWVGWIVYARWLHPYANYPGPFLASISRLWLTMQVAGGSAEKTQRKLHDRYGPIIRIAPNEVAIADPTAIKSIYSINSGYTKTDFYIPWRPSLCRYPDSFTCIDEKVHAQRRRIVNSIYSMSSIVQAEGEIDVCLDLFLTRLGEFADSGAAMDMSVWTQWFAFDVIGQLFFSRMFGFLNERRDHRDYIKSLETLLPTLATASSLPRYGQTLALLAGAALPSVFKALSCLKDVEKAAEDCVHERQRLLATAQRPEKKDILASLMEVADTKGEKLDFGLSEVKVEVYVALFAGSDTTAAAISAILYYLAQSPVVIRKLKEEILQAVREGSLSGPRVRYSQASKLVYLDACCKEGMRMHPSVGLTLPRVVPPEGREIAGQWFPGGLHVGVNAAVVHRDKSIFGDDADVFNPDRWLRGNADNMDRHMFQFGGGARTCIGKNISLCEMYKLIPEILLRYDLRPVDADWETHNYWFNKPSKVMMKVFRSEDPRAQFRGAG